MMGDTMMTLQVRYVRAYTNQDKSRVKAIRKLRFNRNWTIKKALEFMSTEGRMTNMENKWLYVPNSDPKVLGYWLRPEKTFAECGIKEMDEVEVKNRPKLVVFGVWSSLTDIAHCPWQLPPPFSETKIDPTISLEVDFREPLQELVPFLPDLLGGALKRGEEYIFQHLWTEAGQSQRKWLHTGLSLEEQEIVPGSILVLTPLGPFLKRPLNSIKNPEKSGFLMKQSIKDNFLTDTGLQLLTGKDDKRTGAKKRWFILEDNLLYYYQSKIAHTPSGLIPLEYCSISQIQNLSADRVNKFMFELLGNVDCFTNRIPHYLIFEENEAQVREWMKIISYKCANCSDKRVFEVSINKTMKHTKGAIPNIIVDTVKYIEERAMDVEGIFRKSGGMISVQKYRDLYDNGEEPNISECSDPHAVAGLLKLYLRSLPEPITSFELYDPFREASQLCTIEEKVATMRKLVNSLPRENKLVLDYLIDFIGRVAEHASQNLMHIPNLATVFGPNLLRPKNVSAIEMMSHTTVICAIVETLIGKREEIFADVKVEIAAWAAQQVTKDQVTLVVEPERTEIVPQPALTEQNIQDFTQPENPIQAVQEELQTIQARLDELDKKMLEERLALERITDLTSLFIR